MRLVLLAAAGLVAAVSVALPAAALPGPVGIECQATVPSPPTTPSASCSVTANGMTCTVTVDAAAPGAGC